MHEVRPDGVADLEVKAYFETSRNNQCVAFEFKTHDLDLDEMTATFVSYSYNRIIALLLPSCPANVSSE